MTRTSRTRWGFYTFDRKTGLIDDVELLFPDTEDLELGDEFVIDLDKGEGYGLFLIPNAGEIGLDLSQYEDGGLAFRNFLTGKQASIYDRMAPHLVGEDGTPLPIPAFHALDVNTPTTGTCSIPPAASTPSNWSPTSSRAARGMTRRSAGLRGHVRDRPGI